MAQPTPYDRQYSFASYQAQHPSDPLPGDEVDAELNAVKASLDETQANLALIQRDDGQLANGSVGIDQLAPEITVGLTPAIMWAPDIDLAENQSVFYNLVLYRTLADCNTGGAFNAAQFVELADLSSIAAPGGSIGTAQLADGCITTPKLADGAVTPAKMSGFAAGKLIGRYSATLGDLQTITVTGGLALSVSGELKVGTNIPGPLGIGVEPTNAFDIQGSVNGGHLSTIKNTSLGSSAYAGFRAQNSGTDGLSFVVLGHGYPDAFPNISDWGRISATQGLVIDTSNGRPIRFAPNQVDAAQFAPDGSLLVGSATGAGAGCIAATGDITAFYSDDRMKTRLGPIENALDIVKSLDGFYYEENDFAVSLGYERKRQIGLSAQQVQKVVPEVIDRAPISDKAKIELLTMHYDRLVAVMVEAIKALDAKKADK